MTDYAGNSKKDKERATPPEKKIERVVQSEVVIQKKSLGRKFRDAIVEADFKSVMAYVVADKLIPAVRNTIVDVSTAGIERWIYGERMTRRMPGGGPRYSYHTPVNRSPLMRDPRMAPSREVGPRRMTRQASNDIILSSREEAELVLETMNDVIDKYEVVSVADLHELVGLPASHVDNKYGWVFLGDATVRQIREGYLLDLPPAEPMQ